MQLLCVVSNGRIPRLFVAVTAGGSSTDPLRQMSIIQPAFISLFLLVDNCIVVNILHATCCLKTLLNTAEYVGFAWLP